MVDVYDFSQQYPFLKEHEYKDGDIFIFDSEGRLVDDKWGSNRLQMEVILPNRECRTITVNKTSLRNIAAKWGNHTQSSTFLIKSIAGRGLCWKCPEVATSDGNYWNG